MKKRFSQSTLARTAAALLAGATTLFAAGCPTEPNTTIEKPQPGKPFNQEIDGIMFNSAEGLTQAEIDGIEAKLLAIMTPTQIAELSGLKDYVASVTIIQTGNRNISLNGENKAVITTTLDDMWAAMEAGKAQAYDKQNPGIPPEPVKVIERTSIRGDTIEFWAAGIEQDKIDEIITDVKGFNNTLLRNVASASSKVITVLEVEGGRTFEWGTDGRLIVTRDGTAGTMEEDLLEAQEYHFENQLRTAIAGASVSASQATR